MRAILFAAALAVAACGSPAAEQQAPEPPPVAFDGALVSQASAQMQHGKRLASVLGCTGCHGRNLEGTVWFDDPKMAVLHASNLTTALQGYTDEQLETLLREGKHPTGRDVWGMPSELFYHLSQPDMDALILHLRTLEPTGKATPPPVLGPGARELIAKGEIKPSTQFVQETKDITPVDLGPAHSLGRYITMTTCAECHGPRLEGKPNGNPDLATAGAYTREEFEKLITEGNPTGGRQLKELMVNVSKGRFSKLTPHERDALYAYLKARAEQPQ